MSRKGQTNRQVTQTIFGKVAANKILSKPLTSDEFKEEKYTNEDKKEDDLMQSIVDIFLKPTL